MQELLKNKSASFRKWIGEDKFNRIILTGTVVAVIGQFILFKWFYPFPNFMPDSYSYLYAAYQNFDINMWPVGYSKFVRFFSAFTHSDTGLVLVQYLILQASLLYFLFTLRYLLKLNKIVSGILFIFCVLNPVILHVSNFISSDALFSGLSITWLTQLLWLVLMPKDRLLISHAIIILLSFTVRYNALYYPIISMLAITISHISMVKKALSVGIILLLIGLYGAHTVQQYKKQTHTYQFSAFGGWQLASNALFMYAHIRPEDRKPIPKRFSELHHFVDSHMDSLNTIKSRPDTALGIYYLWDEKAPLKKYMNNRWRNDTITDNLVKYASEGPLFADYGYTLISRYPKEFVRHFLWPNLINYYVPAPEFLGVYNMGRDSVDQMGKIWFNYKSRAVRSQSRTHLTGITSIYPILLALINCAFVLGIIALLCLVGLKPESRLQKVLGLVSVVWLSNILFSVLASPIVLRYQIFPMVFCFAAAIISLAEVITIALEENNASEKKVETYYDPSFDKSAVV